MKRKFVKFLIVFIVLILLLFLCFLIMDELNIINLKNNSSELKEPGQKKRYWLQAQKNLLILAKMGHKN